jgi:hypothetical protein
MPVEFGIWKIGAKPERIPLTGFERERMLEDALWADISILDPDLMLIGRQVATDYQKYIDLLAIRSDGTLVVIELKRDKTPREVVAQALDYASWVKRRSHHQIVDAFKSNFPGHVFETAFTEHFGDDPPEDLNENHQVIIVATGLDNSTERIVTYLSEDYGVPLNVVFVQAFRQNGETYLARSWLISPERAEINSERALAREKTKEPWNGQDYYVPFAGGSNERVWDDAIRYGFISAGGGRRHVAGLLKLQPGNRVWIYIPGKGYVGVGKVIEPAQPFKNFTFKVGTLRDQPLTGSYDCGNHEDPDLVEQAVRVEWLATKPETQAVREKGFFANQHACRLRNQFTLERLVAAFGLQQELASPAEK